MSKSKLDEFADLIGKVPADKIAETAGASLAEVEAWIATRAGGAPPAAKPPKPEQPTSKPAARAAPRAPRVEVIRVKATTAISVETKNGKRVKVPVPKSIYRGDLARKYAGILKPSEFEILEHAE